MLQDFLLFTDVVVDLASYDPVPVDQQEHINIMEVVDSCCTTTLCGRRILTEGLTNDGVRDCLDCMPTSYRPFL